MLDDIKKKNKRNKGIVPKDKKGYRLEDIHKRYIIKCLARFQPYRVIQENLQKLFDVKISRETISYYNPDHLDLIGKSLCSELQEVFEKEREKYRSTCGDIPIANQTNRIEKLNYMIEKSMENGNYVLAGKHLEQAAKDMGGMFLAKNFQHNFTNTTNVIPHEDSSFTDEQLYAKLNTLFSSANAGTKEEGIETAFSAEIVPREASK